MSSADRTANQPPNNPDAPKSLGMGGEAVQGVHAVQHDEGEGADTDRGRAGDAAGEATADAERAGSEPLPRNREHVPSYGGAGGAPRTSSDQREPGDSRGDQGDRVARGNAPDDPGDPGEQPINPS